MENYKNKYIIFNTIQNKNLIGGIGDKTLLVSDLDDLSSYSLDIKELNKFQIIFTRFKKDNITIDNIITWFKQFYFIMKYIIELQKLYISEDKTNLDSNIEIIINIHNKINYNTKVLRCELFKICNKKLQDGGNIKTELNDAINKIKQANKDMDEIYDKINEVFYYFIKTNEESSKYLGNIIKSKSIEIKLQFLNISIKNSEIYIITYTKDNIDELEVELNKAFNKLSKAKDQEKIIRKKYNRVKSNNIFDIENYYDQSIFMNILSNKQNQYRVNIKNQIKKLKNIN